MACIADSFSQLSLAFVGRGATMTSPNTTSSGIMTCLPVGYVVHTFTQPHRLQSAIHEIYTSLMEGGTNQYLLVLGLTPRMIQRLNEEPRCLGISYKLEWDGSTGLLMIPSFSHELATSRTCGQITYTSTIMGIDPIQYDWIGTGTYKPTPNKGKQPDNGLVPESRRGGNMNESGWPTFVIETGMSESLSQLERDAVWWFNNSGGETRFVLLINITSAKVSFFLWQLAPANSPVPLSLGDIDLLKRMNALPPMTPTPLIQQQPICLQEVHAWRPGGQGTRLATSGQLSFNFEALFNRPPRKARQEKDILFSNSQVQAVLINWNC
ncbi:hypothetical protein N7495_009055 [Penicillium taxi]|uniref:uncharacterized protein n=1 Tax=Penicillium taxi TaxID=168475 RepID=UPI002545665A|nr:uncharacterized protein N7495_009055 [Penicillium taxi]KAJ5889014.1 hypothetical protein N7495_009055 [Penicillium taxi]